MTADFRALCAELAQEVEQLWSIVRDDNNEPHPLANRARALLDQPEPEEPDAFAIVQQRLEQLAGNQQLMIYRWPEAGEWDIHHTNPTSSVQLGEVSGKYSCGGTTLEEAVCNLAELLPTPEATNAQ